MKNSSLIDYCNVLCHTFAGSWVCFDNYNHLAPAVLSVFAQLMSAVMEALKAGKAAVHLQSDDIQLSPSGACFALLDSALKVSLVSMYQSADQNVASILLSTSQYFFVWVLMRCIRKSREKNFM